MSQKSLVVFLHIPKTAGLTVRICVLPRQFKADETFASAWAGKVKADDSHAVGGFADEFESIGIFNRGSQPGVIWFPESLARAAARFHRLPAANQERVRLFYSEHQEFGLPKHLSRPVSYFTMLREPVARVLSHFGFSTRHPPSLSEDIATHVEANLQTRLLAGPPNEIASLSPAERLERAKDNLRACAVVGLTERFDETMLLLKKAYGWRMPFYERRNIGKHRLSPAAVPAEVIGRIEADNSLDKELYAYARELFAAQIREYGPALKRDVRVFRFFNGLWRGGQQARAWSQETTAAIKRYVIDPAYTALSRWGGLRRLVSARVAPRVVAAIKDNTLAFDLWMGKRRVGYFDPQQQRWVIERPFLLFVDERALPGASDNEGLSRRPQLAPFSKGERRHQDMEDRPR